MRVRHDFSARKGKTRKSPDRNDHNVKFPVAVRDMIRTCDILLEVLDAREIERTRNREIEKLVTDSGKKLILILNKVDLVDLKELKKDYVLSDLEPYVLFSSKNKIGKSRLREKLKIEVKKLKLREQKARVGIIGYPNTGKSTLINALAGGGKVSTSAESGHTRAIHKIRFNKDILILDTPGVIPDKEFEERNIFDSKKHFIIGVKTYDKVKDPDMIVMDFMSKHKGKLQKFYGIKEDDVELFIEAIGKKYNFLKQKGKVDTERAARFILKDIQEGKIKN
ncbi:GTPase [Candidatus Pacearchaeota archaeon]|nr:GTPase [Candidatus Pacearchaeota archaeon]|tara:strand:- start:711 stop:1550 length:840 start_codon:yes stop_codon:yes gene_type:complete